jgi:pimeloyl-ACP methyl ester carboxylesterase
MTASARPHRPPARPSLRAAALVALLPLALLLASCGGGSDDPPASAAPPTPSAGTLKQVAVLSRAGIDAAAAGRGWLDVTGTARCDVSLLELVHPTTGPSGQPTTASGAVFVPTGAGCEGPRPLLSYSRGTDLERSRALARPDDRESQAVMAFFAARGYLVVASDYLGYAQSDFPYHPYLHADSVARTNVDALLAARRLLAPLGIADDGRLFVTGYSQGGHAALATQRAIERDRPAGLAVVASGPMSGPYDLVGSFSDLARLLPLLASLGGSQVTDPVALRLGDVVGTGVEELLASQDTLRAALVANTVIGWRPVAPVLLCGGARDPVVPFSNTLNAAADFVARGANVVVVDVDREPAWRSRLPPPDASFEALGSYHQGEVPPLCFAAVRDRLFEPLR